MTDVEIPSVMNSKQKFNQRLITTITQKLRNCKIDSTPEDVNKIVSLLNEGKNREQLTEEITSMFSNDKDKLKTSFLDWLIGYSNACYTPTTEADTEEVKSTSDKASFKAENKVKNNRRVSLTARNRRSIIETPITLPPSPPKSSRASSVSSGDYEKSQKNIYHQKRLSRSANTLDLTSQVQSEIMAQIEALAAAAAVDVHIKNDRDAKRERRKSVRSVQSTRSRKSSFSSVKEEDTSRIRCQYWPTCNRGDQCKFWHPKELCKKFPNCPNGDKCLYIHPAVTTPSKPQSKPQSAYRRQSQSNMVPPDLSGERSAVECKYGSNCTRLDCKFSHPSPAVAKLNKQSSTTQEVNNKNSKSNVPCHYYPNCKNADCPYMHPTPTPKSEVNVACRYGSACTRQDCHFLHPSNRKI